MDNQVRRAIDSNLSCMRVMDCDIKAIMAKAREGRKAKKKLSVGIVLVIILILATVTALAVTALSDYFSG